MTVCWADGTTEEAGWQDRAVGHGEVSWMVYIYIYTYIYIYIELYIYTYNDGIPKWMVYNGKPIKIDDLGVPAF